MARRRRAGAPGAVEALLRPAAVIGAQEQIGGFTAMNDWHAPELEGAKAYDFATSLGPVVVTPDEHTPPGVDWDALVDQARRNTELLPETCRRRPGRAH